MRIKTLPVNKRGTSMIMETTAFTIRQQLISILVLRNLSLYFEIVRTPSSQSRYAVAKLRFSITWINFPSRFCQDLNSLEVAILTMSMTSV